MLDQIGEFQIFEILSEIPQTEFCKRVGISRTMLWSWVQQDPARRQKLQDAKQARADRLADEAHEVPMDTLREAIEGLSRGEDSSYVDSIRTGSGPS